MYLRIHTSMVTFLRNTKKKKKIRIQSNHLQRGDTYIGQGTERVQVCQQCFLSHVAQQLQGIRVR